MNFFPVTLEGTGEAARLKGDGIEIPLPAGLREGVGATTGRDFIVGVRPEHLDVAAISGDYATAQSKADVVEYLGNEELLHVMLAGIDIVAVVSAERGVRPGDVVTLHFPLDKIISSTPRPELSVRRTKVRLTVPAGDAPFASAGGPPGRPAASGRGRRRWPRREPRIMARARTRTASRPARGAARQLGRRPSRPYLDFRVETWSAPTAGVPCGRSPATRVPWPSSPSTQPGGSSSSASTATRRAGPVEIPAGTLDRDPATGAVEDPDAAARRELEEETGHRAERWERLTAFWTAPGFATERMTLYLATGLAPADGERLGPDEDEALELVRLPWREAVAAAERGEIVDAKSLVGLLWLARRLEGPPGDR